MEEELKEIKADIRSVLTTSKLNLSVKDLQRDYLSLNGRPINYRKLGFSSIIELLLSFNDIVTLPENPDENSIISFNVGGKSKHLRLLVEKQKSNSKRSTSSSRQRFRTEIPNSNNNGSFSNNNRSRSNLSHRSNNFNESPKSVFNNHIQYRHYHNPGNNNQGNQSPLSDNQNGIHRPGVLTNSLRLHIEKVLCEHKMGINKDEFMSILKRHQDFSLLKATSLCNLKYLFDSFIEIKESKVFLKSSFKNNNHNNNKNEVEVEVENENVSVLSNSESKEGKISVYKNLKIPEKVLLNFVRIFNVYNKGLNVDNFELLYNILFDHFDSVDYGFETTIHLFKVLDQMIEVRKNIIYKKKEFKFNNQAHLDQFYNEKKKKNIQCIVDKHNKFKKVNDVALDIVQEIFCSDQDSAKTQIVLAHVHDPTLFYLNLYSKTIKLADLMAQMKLFYTSEDSKGYNLLKNNVYPGMTYVTSYTTFPNENKKWFRVRVLQVSDANEIVKIIHVDYGTIDFIPKLELKFLKKQFACLPCQAIRCCLNSYEDLHKVEAKVTNAFLNIIGDKPLWMAVDDSFIFDSFCNSYQILHVTLFQKIKATAVSEYFHNVNNELTVKHL